jgi:hypothetical protein
MQDVIPKGMSRFNVACEMRPKPRKPAVRFGEMEEELSCGPQKAKGAQLEDGHC